MFWKVYFVVYSALCAISLLIGVASPGQVSAVDWIGMAIFTPLAIAGLWSFAYQRPILPVRIWKGVLFASVFWETVQLGSSVPKMLASISTASAQIGPTAVFVLIAIVFVISFFLIAPPLVALYRNAYPRDSGSAA